MGRSNAVVIGAVVLGPLILGLEGYATYRSHHRQRAPEVADPSPTAAPEVQEQPAPAPAGPVPQIEQPARADPARTAAEPVAAAEPTPDPTFWQRQRSSLEPRRQIVRAADEQVFDTLNLPEAQRAAIRAIDDRFGRAVETGLDPNAEQARRAAIADLLGTDAIRSFTFAEKKAERLAHRQPGTQVPPGE
ncbi:MAG TPA: hypothetical protein VH853_17400 [Polyangia bacterium]|jgi:hypothetical protein|nr:hypothetical protein [Polyangia bacterium]